MKNIFARWMLLAAILSPAAGCGRFVAPHSFSPPQVFAPGLISSGKEFGLSFTPDGKEAYFTRFDAEKKTNHIYRAIFMNNTWQAPVPLKFSRDEWRDLDASVSPDGKKLFFISTRPKPGRPQNSPGDMDIWVADRDGDEWTAPRWLENVNSEAKEGSPSVDRDGTLYFFSDRGSAPNSNSIYSAKLIHGNYSAPERLPPEVNSGVSDTSPFISPDGKTLLFYSNRPGGYGKGDLYVSLKKKGKWTSAVNLGATVNSQDSEYNPSVSPNGRYLYFGRNRNIYEIDIRAIGMKSLRPGRFH